jgi:hypothetical protein
MSNLPIPPHVWETSKPLTTATAVSQGHAITKHISRNWPLASMGQQTSIFTPRNNASVEAGNEGLMDILGLQGAFINTGLKKGDKVFQDGKKSCTVIDAAKKAFKPVIRPESTEGEVEAGIKKTRGILKRYVDRGSHKRAKKGDVRRRSKKAKVSVLKSATPTLPFNNKFSALSEDVSFLETIVPFYRYLYATRINDWLSEIGITVQIQFTSS